MLLSLLALAALTTVEGTVADSVTKYPVAAASVKLVRGDKDVRSAVSDAQGRFRFEGVAGGEYRLSVRRDGYMDLAWHQPGGQPFAVSAAGNPVRLNVELIPRASLTGRVLSPAREPLKGVMVGMRRLWHRHWVFQTVSGDGGVFRFERMEPGTWILAALPSASFQSSDSKSSVKPLDPPPAEDGQRMGWAWTYFPGSIDLPGAERIVLRPGASLEGYDIRLRTVPVRRVSGVVLNDDGKPLPNAGLTLSDVANSAGGGFTTADARGLFTFDAVQEGDWRIGAQSPAATPRLRGFTDVRVGRLDISGIEVRVAAPFPVKGFVERQEPRDREGKRKVTAIYLLPESGFVDFENSTFHEQDGSFVFERVYAGRYRVLPAGHVPDYYVASIWYGGRNVTTQPFDIVQPPLPLRIVYNSGAGRVSGTVEKGAGAWAVLIPEDEALRDAHQFIRRARCDEHGRFHHDSVRPGGYYAFAFDGEVEVENLENPELVRRLAASAVRVEIRAGETAQLELRPQPWPGY